ncbi:hypothetical protein TRIUR3_30741 [Triticum urartu]|uniref:Uncharacterized protein n=1 Tax=Triticum urartu TaxID=4572 RepID=M8A7G2_TRIUA|nr:hypothetical protein TRIUR3_30741 [Triticum urartu]
MRAEDLLSFGRIFPFNQGQAQKHPPAAPKTNACSTALSWKSMEATVLEGTDNWKQAFGYQHGPGYTWSVSVAWGYTVQLYPWAVAPHELEVPLQTFKTWRSWANGPFVFNTRPLVSTDTPCYRPAMFFLSRVRNETSRGTVSEYSRHAAKSEKECDQASFRAASTVHTVKVFAPKMNHNEWKRAPRRHCCKTTRTRWGTVLEVRIRYCSRGELTTP